MGWDGKDTYEGWVWSYVPPLRGHGILPRLVEPFQVLAFERRVPDADQTQALCFYNRCGVGSHVFCGLDLNGGVAVLAPVATCTRARWGWMPVGISLSLSLTHTYICICMYVCIYTINLPPLHYPPLYPSLAYTPIA